MSVTYIVEQSSSSSGPWTAVTGSPFTSLTDTISGLTQGTNYFFRLTAQDSQLNLTGPSTVFGPITTTVLNLTESTQNTRLTSTSGSIVDANKQAWSLVGTTGSLQVLHPDGTHDGSNVTLLVYWNHIVFRDDSAGWFYWNGVGWAAATGDPATSESIQGMQVTDTVGQINDSSSGKWRLVAGTNTGAGTYATPGSGTITDPGGNIWAIASNGDVTENGNAIVGGSGTSAIDLYNGQIYAQDVTTGTWYLWNGSTFVQQSSAPPNLPGTSVGLEVVQNGVTDTSAINTILLLYWNHVVYRENSSNSWWLWNGAWMPTTDPRVATLTESASNTVLTSTSGSIVDANLVQWTLVLSSGSGLQIAKAGNVDGTTSQVLLLLYFNHFVYEKASNANELNITPGWWYWNGTAWVAVTGDPRSSAANWNPSDKSSGVVLSNNNLTATTSTAGTAAGRIADLLETIGVNCFPNGQDGSGTGYNNGTDTSGSHVTAFQYLTASTGMGLVGRLYEDGSNASSQVTFATGVSTTMPAVKWSACGGFGGSLASTETLADGLQTAGILAFVEGINEPNNGGVHTGGTAFTSAQCLAFQQGIFNRYTGKVPVADASIVIAGGTDFTSYPQDFLGTNKTAEIAACNYWNSHDYPNSGAPSNDMFLWGGGVHQAAGWPSQGVVSEFHPVLFNNTSDEATGAYYTICARLAGFKYYNHQSIVWFSLYDYNGMARPTGLFQSHSPTTPRLPAKYIHNLFKICADTGATRRTFVPGNLQYTVSGLPPTWTGQNASVATGGGQHTLFQDSTGKFYLFIWNEQNALNLTATTSVTVNFSAGAVASVTDYSITHNTTADNAVAIQTKTNVSSITMNLTTEARVLVISGATLSPGGEQSARDTIGYSTGKYYFEVTGTSLTSDFGFGIANSQFDLSNPNQLGGLNDPNGVGYYCVSPPQGIYVGTTDHVSVGTNSDGNGAVMSCAVDFGSKLIWFTSPAMRAQGSTWNNSTTANPGTGTGGVSFSNLNAGPYYVCFNDDLGAAAATVNFGATPFVRQVPTGFSAWASGGQAGVSNSPTFADNFTTLDMVNVYNGTGGPWQPARWYSPDDGGYITNDGWVLNPFNTATPVTGIYSVTGGVASIGIAKTPTNLQTACGGKAYVTSQIQHFHAFKQLHGYFEVRCSTPILQGTGSSIFLMDDIGWPPEIDIMEFPSIGNNPTVQFGKISVWTGTTSPPSIQSQWYTDPNQDPSQTSPGVTADWTQMHQFGVDWQATTLTFFIDRNQVFQCPTPSDYTNPMGVILGFDAGGDWTGPITNPTALPIFMNIDYVQIYKTRPF